MRLRGESGYGAASLSALCVLLPALTGCVHAAAGQRIEPVEGERFDRVRAEAMRRFDRAVMWKPKPVEGGSLANDFAPLLVIEAEGESALNDDGSFGSVIRDEEGRYSVDPSAPAIYAVVESSGEAGVAFDVISFVWFRWTARAVADVEQLPAYGLRIVLDRDGYPVIWVVAGPAPVRELGVADAPLLFVADTLEARACAHFGGPPDGREFCVEPDASLPYPIRVARVLPPGPIPMGPYVYLGAPAYGPTTVLCRCSPSQVESFVGTREYTLRDTAELPVAHGESGSLDDPATSLRRALRRLDVWNRLRLPPQADR